MIFPRVSDQEPHTIKKMPNETISGVIFITSEVVYGSNNKNIPYYRFKPSNQEYSGSEYECIVATRLKWNLQKKGEIIHNYYIVVNVDFTIVLPKGQSRYKANLATILGPVGNIEAEYKNNLYRWKINRSSFTKLLKDPEIDRKIREDIDKLYLPDGFPFGSVREDDILLDSKSVIDLREKLVFSIDPIGCLDIDDALHVDILDQGIVEVCVHIADVDYWISEGSRLDLEAKQRATTIYLPDNKRLDMLPDIYSSRICSLRSGEPRRAITTYLKFKIDSDNTVQLIDYHFAQTLVRLIHNLSYIEAEQMLNVNNDNSHKPDIHQNLINSLEILSQVSNTNDPHKIIEYFMVTVNKLVAQTITDNIPYKSILRVHSGVNRDLAKSYNRLIKSDPSDSYDIRLLKHLEIISMNSAEYVPYQDLKESEVEIYHYGLDVKYYTHFTSPIRRYIDLCTHRFLKILQFTKHESIPETIPETISKNITLLCNQINQINTRVKRSAREIKLLELLHKLEKGEYSLDNKDSQEKDSQEIITDAYVIDITNIPLITIYIPELDLSVSYRLYQTQTDSILIYMIDTNDSVNIENINNKKKISLDLFTKYKIKLIPNLQSVDLRKKVKIEILDDKFKEILL